VIGGKVPPGALPPAADQLEELRDRYQAVTVYPDEWADRSARLNALFRQRARHDAKYARYGGLPRVHLVPEARLSTCGPRPDALLMYSKGRPYAAFFTEGVCVVTERFAQLASDEELLQLAVHARTIGVGRKSINQLNVSAGELGAVLEQLRGLNERSPGWGVTSHQVAELTAAVAAAGNAAPPAGRGSVLLAGVDLDALLTDLDVSPRHCQRVKANALDALATLREREFVLSGRNGSSAAGGALERKLGSLARQHSPAPVRITFVSFGSPWHYALWNNLSIDSLAGDLYGEFGPGVSISLKRAVCTETVDRIADELRRSPPDVIGLSVELGTLALVDRFAEVFAPAPGNGRPLLVVGNQVPTYFPEWFLNHPRLPEPLVCLHEGETTMRGLVEHLQGRRPLSEVPNLVYRDGQSRAIVRTPLKTLDLGTLLHSPTADTARPGITNMIQASRGCIFSCAYCTRHETFDAGSKLDAGGDHPPADEGHNWRPFALARVFNNVECFAAKGITEIEFCDDEFFGGRSAVRMQRVHGFAEGMRRIAKKYGVRLTFRIFTTPLIVARARADGKNQQQNELVRAALEDLIDAGLVRVYIGLESASPAQKQRYERKETVDDTAAALQVLRSLGLDVDVGFIMFDPHLSVEEMLENVRYFRRHALVKHNTWPFRPLVVNEGTPIKQRLEQEGLLLGKRDPDLLAYEYRFKDPVVGRIARTVQDMAKETGAIFYALKTISKAHWKGHETDDMHFALSAVEGNAHIYLDLMERLGTAARDGVLSEAERACGDEARAALLDLVSEVGRKLGEGLFDARAEDRNSLGTHLGTFDREHLAGYRQAWLRTRPPRLHQSYTCSDTDPSSPLSTDKRT
jgi:radical SAM superfamily enzyme YgiQ (UPF0313 family)